MREPRLHLEEVLGIFVGNRIDQRAAGRIVVEKGALADARLLDDGVNRQIVGSLLNRGDL